MERALNGSGGFFVRVACPCGNTFDLPVWKGVYAEDACNLATKQVSASTCAKCGAPWKEAKAYIVEYPA